MPTFAIGDVHGNLAALDDLLGLLSPRLAVDDTVVFLGDYIDRGPNARGCIDRILEFQTNTPAKVVTLLGNHEDWLSRSIEDPTRHSWILGMDAFPTISSYSVEAAERLRSAIQELGPRVVTERVELPYRAFLNAMPQQHRRFLRDLRTYYRDNEAVFVHGGLDPLAGPVERQPRERLLWGVDGFPETYRGSELVVYGHRNDAVLNADGWPRPRFSGTTIGLDTITHGVLSSIELPARRVLQSRRHGARRST